jgi:hypothetical protein
MKKSSPRPATGSAASRYRNKQTDVDGSKAIHARQLQRTVVRRRKPARQGNGIPADARRNVVVGLGKDNEESARIVKLDFGA